MSEIYYIISNYDIENNFNKEKNVIRIGSHMGSQTNKLEDIIKTHKSYKLGNKFSIVKVLQDINIKDQGYFKVLEFISGDRLKKLLVLI